MPYLKSLIIITIAILLFSFQSANAQTSVKLRSVCSITQSSNNFNSSNQKYTIQQCIGQLGISGTISSKNKTLIQGFIQPRIAKAKTSTVDELDVLIKTIPFSDSYKIILLDGETTDLDVSLYNIIGQKIYIKKVHQSNEFEINLDAHSTGCYILCIQANQQQFTTKLLKIN